MNPIKSFFTIAFSIFISLSYASLNKVKIRTASKAAMQAEVTFEAAPSKKNAIYSTNEKIEYNVQIHNPDKAQTGSLTYIIFTPHDKELTRNAMNIKIGANNTEKFHLTMPGQQPGFYKVQIIVNATEYDDTVRRVFGVDPQKISSPSKPNDFDAFWEAARDELGKVAPNFKMTEQPNLERENIAVYMIEASSLDNIRLRGWLTMPKKRRPNQKFPVWLVLPGYGTEGMKPIFAETELAVLSLNVRGQGNSRDVIKPTRDSYVITKIENKKDYIYRGVLMDCIRAVDFIFTRPELDNSQILSVGASMGGYLSIAVSSLDKRIKLCSANNPVFCDYRSLVGSKDFPMKDIEQYAKLRFIPMERILSNLDYFDLKNFAYNLKCRSLIGIGLLDNLAPPYNEYVMLNNIPPNNYKLFVYPELAHEVPLSLYTYISNWSMDEFGIF